MTKKGMKPSFARTRFIGSRGGGFRLHLLTALSSDGDQQWELFGTIGTTVFQLAGCPCFLNCQEW